jgi:hypothetical protein
MKAIRTVYFLLLISQSVLAQDPPRIIPPAPEATSVFKFSEVPVSTYTGLPNISIPIHEIRCKQLTIPINLSYHARGVRVDEMASRVGLGWSLNYGGMMSRQIRGGADEETWGYLTQNYYNDVFADSIKRASMRHYYLYNNLDMVPDKFMFDANGTSGSFIFDQITKETLLQEFEDIIITKNQDLADGNKIKAWVLTDASGNKFYYGKSKDGTRQALDYEQVENFSFSTTVANLGGGGDYSYSTWHLMEIETPFNENIRFEYEQEEVEYYRHSYDQHTLSPNEVTSYFSRVRAYQYQLKRIVYDQGEIVFLPSESQREDLKWGYVLEKIRIFNNVDTVAVKEYELTHSYTTSPTNYNQLNHLRDVDTHASKRLFLSSVQERGQSGEEIPAHTFHYNTTLLPNRFSTSQDAWGYYNGANNGQFLTFFTYGTTTPDRTVNESFSEAGLLKKVIYPTGGSVEFTYEPNVAVRPTVMNDLMLPSLHKIIEEQFLDGFIKHPDYLTEAGVFEKDSILIGDNLQGDVFFEIDLPFCPQGPPENGVEPECVYSVRLRSNTGAYQNLYPFGTAGERERLVSVPPGMYTLEVIQNDPSIEGSLFYITLSWEEQDTLTVSGITDHKNMIPGAGKRIKKIEYKGIDTTFVKEYEYLRPEGLSSGVILGLPGFYSTRQTSAGGTTVGDFSGCIPGSPLSTYQGNSVGYSYVTEYYGTKESNIGKTEFEFTAMEDGGEYYKYPYHLPIDNEWRRGKNRFTKTYQRDISGTYNLVKSVENSYRYKGNYLLEFEAYDSASYDITRTAFKLPLLVFGMQTIDDPDPFKIYYQTGGTVDHFLTRETFYGNSFGQIETETRYYYDYDRHYQLRAIENIRSDSTKEITTMSYAGDYQPGIPFIESMAEHNLVSFPIEKVTYQKRNEDYHILSGVLNKYMASSPVLLDEVSVLENAGPVPLSGFRFSNRSLGVLPLSGTPSGFLPDSRYVPKIKFGSYDTKGNILQYSMSDNIKVSYVWGYNQSFPVAEIRNASYGHVLSALGQTVVNELSTSPGTDDQVRLKLQPLYSDPLLKDAQVTIFTYNTSFGVTSITDNNGLTIFYIYDSFGRLKKVVDKDQNMMKQIQYNYKSAN